MRADLLSRRGARAESRDESAGSLMQIFFRHMCGAPGAVILALAASLLIWPFARLDFDRHHDGYMVAQALAVHQGASVQAEVFAQYGPVTPWFQSLALFLPLGPALALRTLNLAFIAVTVFLLADMGRNAPRNWPISRAVGWWAALAWILLADLWTGIPMLPWSSTLTAMLSVATLYSLTRSMRLLEDGSTRAASVLAICGGVCVGLMPFTRINVGLSAMAVLFVLALLAILTERGVKRTLAGLFVLGSFVSVLTVGVILVGTGSLADFYYQAIQWPLTWGRKATGVWNTQAALTGIVASQTLPTVLVCAALYLQSRSGTIQRGWSVTRSGARMFTLLVGLIVVGWEGLRGFADAQGVSGGSGASSHFVELISANVEYRYFFMVLTALVATPICIIQAVRYISGRRFGDGPAWIAMGGLALSGLTQIIPTWDLRHVWWAAPVGLLLLFSVVRSLSELKGFSASPLVNPLTLPLLVTAVLGFLSASAYGGSERVEGQPGTIIEGMLVSKATFNQINQDTDFLRKQLENSGTVVYLADDGDLSVLGGKYRSADSYFVDWGGAPQIQTRIANGNPVVVQASSFGEDRVSGLAHLINYKVVARNPRLVVLRPASVAGPSGS